MRILVLNGGTGTIKAALASVVRGTVTIERRATVPLDDAAGPAAAFDAILAALADGLDGIHGIGHRVVHGGLALTEPAIVDAAVEAEIARLVPLAPLHNPVALTGIATARRRWPTLPMVAVFDTAFHARRSDASRRYALPTDLVQRHDRSRPASRWPRGVSRRPSTRSRCSSGGDAPPAPSRAVARSKPRWGSRRSKGS